MATSGKMPLLASQSSRRPMLDNKDSTVESTLLSPGIVKINVQGAYIVDEGLSNPDSSSQDGAQHDTDIRLPNHQGVVSHIALDVRMGHLDEQLRLLMSYRLEALSLSSSTSLANLMPRTLVEAYIS